MSKHSHNSLKPEHKAAEKSVIPDSIKKPAHNYAVIITEDIPVGDDEEAISLLFELYYHIKQETDPDKNPAFARLPTTEQRFMRFFWSVVFVYTYNRLQSDELDGFGADMDRLREEHNDYVIQEGRAPFIALDRANELVNAELSVFQPPITPISKKKHTEFAAQNGYVCISFAGRRFTQRESIGAYYYFIKPKDGRISGLPVKCPELGYTPASISPARPPRARIRKNDSQELQ